MLSVYLICIAIIGMICGGICLLISNFSKQEIFQVLTLAFCGIAFFSAIFGVIEKHIEDRESSSSYYYDMLEEKTFIEEQLDIYEEEIKALHSGKVEGVVFKNKNEMVKLNNTIERYNFIILRHREYKDNYWHYKRYNEAIANLNTFEVIF